MAQSKQQVQELGSSDFKRHRRHNIIYHRDRSGHHQGVISFYTPWCQHCKNFKPDMELLAQQGIPMKALDCDKHPELAYQLGVSTYPSIGFVNHKGQIYRYSGTRKKEILGTAYHLFQKKHQGSQS
jgi:thioredoxin-like negative regulator of GroEL